MGTIQKQDLPDYFCGERQWETKENIELYEAASDGDYKRLRDALECGANANFWSKSGEKLGSLHAAARSQSKSENGSVICAKELIDSGARVSDALISNRNEPIHEAANAGSEPVCRVLIEASPSCAESVNSFGNTALHAAARSGSPDVVRLLLERGADINKKNHRGSTALHIACFLTSDRSGTSTDPYIQIGAILLCNDELKIDAKDVNGYTPLHIAAQRGGNVMVRMLIDSGFSISAKTGKDSKGRGGRTPVGMAVFGGQNVTKKILEEAITAGKDAVTKTMAKELQQLP